jgi:CheY-like chemotaxis protein
MEKGLEFEVKFLGPIPHMILTDPMRLREILINLLHNAIKFTKTGKISIQVADKGTGSDKIVLHIDLIDTGIGILPEQLTRLFQPFTQGDESITRKFGGTGLGLTISRRLARLLNGDVTVSSKFGVGSVFTMKIDGGPSAGVEILQDLIESSLPTTRDQGVSANVPLSGRILLVEDGPDNQQLLSMQLTDAGAEVINAENGQIAVDLTASQPFDLILMDMQMPVLDGYAATTELRKRGLTTPIIALTAYAMAEDRAKCMACGCADYLTKPIDEEKLLKTVSRHLGNKNLPLHSNGVATSIASASSPLGDASPRIQSTLAHNPRMMHIIPKFVSGLPDKVHKMIELLEHNDLVAVGLIVHQLLGACGGYGFDTVTAPATRAEVAIKTNQTLESINTEIKSLIEVIRQIDGYDESKTSVTTNKLMK